MQRCVVSWKSSDIPEEYVSCVLFFNPEDGGDMFLRNVYLFSTNYVTLYLRR
jgi:hypothetical protein